MSMGTNIGANEIARGNILLINGELYKVDDLDRVKPGKGGAFIQVEAHRLANNKTKDKKLNLRFRSGENVTKVDIFDIKCTLFFKNDNECTFIRNDTKDEVVISIKDFDYCKDLIDGKEYVIKIAEDDSIVEVVV